VSFDPVPMEYLDIEGFMEQFSMNLDAFLENFEMLVKKYGRLRNGKQSTIAKLDPFELFHEL
jgi:hypothetical protein